MHSSSRAFDPIAVLEGGYGNFQDRTAWYSAIAKAIAPALDRGHGLMAYRIEMTQLAPTGFVNLGACDDHFAEFQQHVAEASNDPKAREALQTIDPIGLFGSRAVFGEGTRFPGGSKDAFAFSVVDGEGTMHVFVASSADDVSVAAQTDSLMWKRLALHLGASARLHNQAGSIEDGEVEAVIEPSGKLVHAQDACAEQSTRQALREITKRIERARTKRGRTDANEALSLWEGLVLGRWSLVDHFDSDGRRFVLARRNDPNAPVPGELTRRERQIVFYASMSIAHKNIGYALGLSTSTVATHLRTALDKLGLASRAELIAMVASLQSGR
jgi:DNA-binding CsgD family transcriptional regulator